MTQRVTRPHLPRGPRTARGLAATREGGRQGGLKAAEYRRQERLLLGRPAHLILKERRWAAALLFGTER